VVNKILEDIISQSARPFFNDIGVKGPRSRYNEEEEEGLPGIRRFIIEYLRRLDAVLADLERAGVTIAGQKSKFCMTGLKIVGYICDADGRYLD
jgi:hypothetical protein